MSDKRFLELLAKKYPNEYAAAAEIINLNAILSLPKGTEYFLSDLHGEYEAFVHMIKSASGVIRTKIEETFQEKLPEKERDALAALIYDPKAEIKRRKKAEEDTEEWYYNAIYNMIAVCRSVSTKYSRSKARTRLPKYWGYSMDELLHADGETNRAHYYNQIIKTILETGVAEEYLIKLAEVISTLAVDKLHIIGDIYDRGAHPELIMDFLIKHHDVDIQWGNHDIVWMGAATGNWACITNVLRMNIAYNNFDMLEIGYGLNLRPLAVFAAKVYRDDPCDYFKPKVLEQSEFDEMDEELVAKMHKAIAICQFKVEGEVIRRHPEYNLEHRLSLNFVDYKKGTITIGGEEFSLRDDNFPTIDPDDPYKLTKGEIELLNVLEGSIRNSEKIEEHIAFLYSNGSMYKVSNGNLLYHGCIPINEAGEFDSWEVNGKKYRGKELLDYLDDQVRKAYFAPSEAEETGISGDLMWYLWLGPKSPFFGKDQMTTFERCFVTDKKTHKENTSPYYVHIEKKETCQKILAEFGLPTDGTSHILNGHVPVKFKDGESPIRAEGLRYIIDGGISKAYQKTTGIAGYTLIFNSFNMALVEHKPYKPMEEDGTQEFVRPTLTTVKTMKNQLRVRDIDQGEELKQEVRELEELRTAFQKGVIPEEY